MKAVAVETFRRGKMITSQVFYMKGGKVVGWTLRGGEILPSTPDRRWRGLEDAYKHCTGLYTNSRVVDVEDEKDAKRLLGS